MMFGIFDASFTGNPHIGVLKHKDKLYAFSSKEAALNFASSADDFVAEIVEKATISPELIHLLKLWREFSCVTPCFEVGTLSLNHIHTVTYYPLIVLRIRLETAPCPDTSLFSFALWLFFSRGFADAARREFTVEADHQVWEWRTDWHPSDGNKPRQVIRVERVGAAEKSYQAGESEFKRCFSHIHCFGKKNSFSMSLAYIYYHYLLVFNHSLTKTQHPPTSKHLVRGAW